MRNSILTISGIVALVLGSISSAEAITLSLTPEQASFQAGSTGIVDVVASGLTDAATGGAIGAYDLNITFDPAILSYASTTFGTGLNVTGAGDIQSSGLNSAGNLETFEVSFDTPHDLATLQPNSFVLFSIVFNGLMSGASSLGLEILGSSDESGNSLSADVQNSALIVTPVPLPAAGWLLLSGLGAAFGRTSLRRRS
jgi:hypothetical protein